MPTVIDSLLIVLDLDPTKLNQHKKEALESFVQLKNAAQSSGKNIEQSGAKLFNLFGGIRTQILGMTAALLGANGIKQFVANTVQADDALGRTAKRIDENIESLSQWQNALRLSGGTAEDATQSFGGLVKSVEDFKALGEVSGSFKWFNALHIDLAKAGDINKLEDRTKLMFKISEELHKLPAPTAYEYGQGMGLTPGMINLIMQGTDALKHYYDEGKQVGIITKENINAARKLDEGWTALSLTLENFGRGLLTWLSGPAVGLGAVGDSWNRGFGFPNKAPTSTPVEEDISDNVNITGSQMRSGPSSVDLALAPMAGVENVPGGANITGRVGGYSIQDSANITGRVRGREGKPYYALSSSGNPAKLNQAQSDIEQFMRWGWSRAQATGIVANIMKESHGVFTANNHGVAYGLAQWEAPRQATFKDVMHKNIKDSTRDEQLAFIQWELRNSEAAAGRALDNASSGTEAARIFSKLYERPRAADWEQNIRASYAQALSSGTNVGYNTKVPGSGTVVNVGSINVNIAKATDADGIAAQAANALKSRLATMGGAGGMQ